MKKMKNKYSGKMQQDNNHAERFMRFVRTLDRLQSTFNLDVLECLNQLVEGNLVVKNYNMKGCWYSKIKDKDKDGGNPRRSIPSLLIQKIKKLENPEWLPVKKAKVPHSWISCYIFGNCYPNQLQQGWQSYQCSHRCTVGECINPAHLCWESAAINQSRGRDICASTCKHKGCGKNLCVCQQIHVPSCIIARSCSHFHLNT